MRKIWIAAGLAVAAAVAIAVGWRLRSHDDWPAHDGKLRQTVEVEASGLRRGGPGTLALTATGHYVPKGADAIADLAVPRISDVALTLVDAAGKETRVAFTAPKRTGRVTRGEVTLPDVPDGDYHLRVDYRTRLGPGEVDVPLALYAPARIHVITDRPLYEPGNRVRFRAVVLRAHDLAPLDGRPGTWVVTDPAGNVLLEQRADAGPWGVIAGSFLLERAADPGDWKVAWRSGDAVDERTFAVRTFTLPRFRVEASADRPYYHRLDTPTVRGSVVYSSGAPVAGAELAIDWKVSGDWPPPTAWLHGDPHGGLPQHAVAGANGRFELTLPSIPADLVGNATLTGRISAVDPAGDRVEGQVSVLLAADRIAVSAVTEVGDGLVGGSNNRVYLRVTRPDGQVIPDAMIHVKRAWQPDDPGVDARLDVDGVAALQLDPGPPVNVVIPALPYRPPVLAPVVSRDEPDEMIAGDGATLADQLELDRWLAPLASCARWTVDNDVTVPVAVRVSAAGALTAVASTAGGPLARCAVDVVRGRRLPAGRERLYSIAFTFQNPATPSLEASVESAPSAADDTDTDDTTDTDTTDADDSSDGTTDDNADADGDGVPDRLGHAVDTMALRARSCLPAGADGSLPRALSWQMQRGQKEILLGPWIADPDVDGGPWVAAALACVTREAGATRIVLAHPARSDRLGLIRFTIHAPTVEDEERPQATTMLGYELEVTADLPDEVVPHPSTRLRLPPGTVPALRLRVAPVVAAAGQQVTAELIRGPDFAAQGRPLPAELSLTCGKGIVKQKVDAKHQAILTLPADADGWCQVDGGDARALVYVAPKAGLTVSVTPGRATYAPGEQAELTIHTLVGGQGGPAAVGLFGVDDSLGQLVALPGADDLARVRPAVTTPTPAFGVLDGQALTLGRIRGANAAAATVLRVGTIPTAPDLDAVVSAKAATQFDPVEELTERFYDVLAELHAQTRAWEASAPPGELMRPATMARLWKQALAACAARGEPVVDAFGRKLRLSRLPPDLLALTDPRAVVVVGTRLPEDVEDWAAWVAKEKP
ncbi:MAG TPA: MG2 domain-containing protein [Kofleriaceae bacterium]|nr:MG2 domain-containing protein [Kofleriaceae bacterium]